MFPDGDEGFRSRKEKTNQTFLDQKGNPEEDRETAAKPADGFFVTQDYKSTSRKFDLYEADDDFMNVSSAPGIEAREIPSSETSQDRRGGVDRDQHMQSETLKNDSFTE